MVKALNWINGAPAETAAWLDKVSPVTEEVLWPVCRSLADSVSQAVEAAAAAQPAWAALPPVARGDLLNAVAASMERNRQSLAAIVSQETGKSLKDALGETDGAIKLARFYAGEGQRLYGRTTTSGTPGRTAHTIRQPVGVAGLIAAANTPIANVAWKVFPALICGNTVVFKAAEDTPLIAFEIARLAAEAGLPAGVLNVIQGLGPEAGEALVKDPRVGVVSFTGSTRVGQRIGEICAQRLAKCSLELGGKNPFVVLNDAGLDKAVHWASLSAFSNAGQRCASASRIIVEEGIYEAFKAALVAKASALKLGPTDEDDLGPVINGRQMENILATVSRAVEQGARVLCGGRRADRPGWFIEPTILEGPQMDDEISQHELFGPVTILYQARDYSHALELANASSFGLTACIHTSHVHRAWHFVQHVRAGVASINGATYGSEPHMPFGGVGQSGNGTREPGTEALDIYCNLKNILVQVEAAEL